MTDLLEILLFPRHVHERSPDPGPFGEPRSYKPYLQREFRRKCVYCRMTDGWKGAEAFGVDHYLPRSKFPDLGLAWPNLFYACNVCNTWKSDSVSTAELFLPNPCAHRMSDHLQYRGAEVETFTPHGEWLAELLHLAERREVRELILAALGQFLKVRNELLEELTAYEAPLAAFPDPSELESIQEAHLETAEELEKVEGYVELLIGEPIFSGSD